MKYPVVIEDVYVPQKKYLKGTHFFDMILEDPLLPKKTKVKDAPWDNKLNTWMVSCPPAWLKTGYTGNFYKFGDDDKAFTPRIEMLFGNYIHDHDIIQKARGTQPFGSYLRGHLNSCIGKKGFPLRTYSYIEIQHYYTSDKIEEDFSEEQAYMTYFGLKVLLQNGFVRDNFPVLCFDKSWPLDKYLIDDVFLTVSVGEIIKFWEETPYPEALERWRKFSEYGKTYTDKEVALRYLGAKPFMPPSTMQPILLNEEPIQSVALEIISKLGISKMLGVWIWKSRVAGTSNEGSDVDLWIEIPEEYAEEVEGFEEQLGYPYKLRISTLDYTRWKYPVLVYESKKEQIALNLENNYWGLPLDIHIGCGLPPKGPYMKLLEGSK